MKATVGVAITLCAVGLGVAACGGPHTPGPQVLKPETNITLQDVGGVCSKPNPVDPVGGHKGASVAWTITNNCNEGTFVTLREFSHTDPANSDTNPMDKYEAIWIDAHSTRKLQGKLKDHGNKDTYHFFFYLDERKQTGDPDIVIDT